MSRIRSILGIVTGVLLVLSAGAHSLMGWPVQRAALAQANAPADLAMGLGAGWHFAGAAMLAFGILVLHAFLDRLRGRPHSLFSSRVAAVLWIAFGIGAWAVSHSGFFLATFLMPGVMLALASFGRDDLPMRA